MRMFIRFMLSGFTGLIFIIGGGPVSTHAKSAQDTALSRALAVENGVPVAQTVPGEIIIQFREGTPPDRVETILSATDTKIKKNLGAPLTYLLGISGNKSVDETIQRLKSISEVLHAEPNYIMRIEPGPDPLSSKRKTGEADDNPR
jgi:hypothetical protein